MTIRTLIVDDVPLARKRIARHLREEADVEIVGECANGMEAVEAIGSLDPDLIFLDVQMPEMDGFEVIAAVGVERIPAVIFVTAYDEFALRAFDVHAVDYLLKPFDRERFQRAVARARDLIERHDEGDLGDRLRALLGDAEVRPRYLKRLAVKTEGHTIFVTAAEVDWIETAGNYLKLHVGDETHMIRERMTRMQERLDPEQFARVHRSTMVNIDRIREMHPLFNGDQLLVLRDGTRLTMSRTYRDNLLRALGES